MIYTIARRRNKDSGWVYPTMRLYGMPVSALPDVDELVRRQLIAMNIDEPTIAAHLAQWRQMLLGGGIDHPVQLQHPETDEVIAEYMLAMVDVPATHMT